MMARISDQQLVTRILQRYRSSSDYFDIDNQYRRKLMRDMRQEIRLKKDAATGERVWQYPSKIVPPLSLEKVSTLVPLVTDAIFGRPNWYSLTRRRGSLDQGDLTKTKALLDWQFENIPHDYDFPGLMEDIIQEAVALGYKVARKQWTTLEENRAYIERAYDMGVEYQQKKIEKKLLYQGPDLLPLAFYRFFPDPMMPPGQLQAANYLTEEIIYSDWEFQIRGREQGWSRQGMREALESAAKFGRVYAERDERDQPQSDDSKAVRLILGHDHEEVGLIATEAGSQGGVLLKRQRFEEACPNERYPYYLFATGINIDDGVELGDDAPDSYHPAGPFPQGALHPLHPIQQLVTMLTNMRLLGIERGLNPQLVIPPALLQDESELTTSQIIHAANNAGVDLRALIFNIPTEDRMGAAYSDMINQALDMADRASGANDVISGRNEPGNDTAFGVAQRVSNTMKRIGRAIALISRRGIQPLVRDWIDDDAQNISSETLAFVMGEDQVPQIVAAYEGIQQSRGFMGFIYPDDIARGAVASVNVAPFVNRLLTSKTLTELMPLLIGHPEADITAALRMILENSDGITRPQEILSDSVGRMTPIDIKAQFAGLDEKIAQVAAMAAQLQALLGQAGPGGTPAAGVGGAAPDVMQARSNNGMAGEYDAQGEVEASRAAAAGM